MPLPVADAGLGARLATALGGRFRVGRLVASSPHRVLFAGTDLVLHREVSIRVDVSGGSGRRWFLREAEALAQLDHPSIRHIYDLGTAGHLAWRIGNWIEGEGLDTAVARSARPIPQVHVLARALLGALEHAHGHGIIVRRILPSSLIIGPSGRGTLTDLRYSSHTLDEIPAAERLVGHAFMAPEVREGALGDPASDVYTASAILYFALTGQAPSPEAGGLAPPTTLRPETPRLFDALLLRGLHPDSDRRFHTAWGMYQQFTAEAGDLASESIYMSGPPEAAEAAPGLQEKLLRRALGDDYELLGEVGRGGFGRVYRVRDLSLERVAALKVLEPALTRDPAAVERFRREAQLAARLRHPHVVAIYEIGGRYGLIWYAMELVEGPNLAQLVEREGPLDRPRVLRLLREGLSALAEAHRGGLIHRDIKPENLLLDPDGGLKITDFGLALALRGAAGFGGATSRSGTPQFASPEQLLGERVDQRTDLYSLAAVACFVLLGRPPFTGRTTREILAKQTTDALPSLVAERPEVGDELAGILARALRADPAARFSSADEFLQAVNYEAQPLPLEESGTWADTATRWLRRSPRRPPPAGGGP